MRHALVALALTGAFTTVALVAPDIASAGRSAERHTAVHLGPRPFFLVDDMTDGPMKRRLQLLLPGNSPEPIG